MEAEQGCVSGARRGQRSERLCSREERKRRTSGLVEDGAGVQQRHSSASSSSHDDRSSAASGLDVADRLTYLEQRIQMQEDEIQLLKLALADVLKRLNISEEYQAAAAAERRTAGAKARPVSLALPPRPPTAPAATVASVKKGSTAPFSGTSRNYSPTPPRCGMKSPPGSVKDSPCTSTKTRPASAASTCKKPPEGAKPKEAAVAAGTRRVTHCKVTMQIYLSPLARKTGSSETAQTAMVVPVNGRPPCMPGKPPTKFSSNPGAKKSSPSYTLNLQRSMTSQSAKQDSYSYKSPSKSPSQYFQICY